MSARAKLVRHLPAVIGGLLTIVVIIGAIRLLDSEPVDDTPARKAVQQVTLLAPPPPPPPPPKVEEPPEPEVEEEVEIEDQVEQVEDVPDVPPMGDLGVDADGSGAGDGFGLIGRKGGRGLLDGDPNVAYFEAVHDQVLNILDQVDDVRKKDYGINVKLWFDDDGSVIRAKLTKSTGNEEIDRLLIAKLTGPDMVFTDPPRGMPQPMIISLKNAL